MEKMTDLRDLLKHEIMDLYSAEEQIIAAMPAMIEKAQNPTLTKLLRDHLKVTEGQLERLQRVQEILGEGGSEESGSENKGLFSRLFSKSGSGSQKCRGMEGLITEGEKVMAEDMSPDVKDAAIIASAQKIEHYEICGYGTARAFARELQLGQVQELLEETLNEEYEADDLLTDLAIGRVNEEARTGEGSGERGRGRGGNRNRGGGSSSGSRGGASSKGGGSKSATKSSGGSKGASKSSSKAASKSSSKGASKSSAGSRGGSSGGSSKGASKSSGGSKGASKGSSSRGGASKSSGGGSRAASKGSKGASKGSASRGGASKSSAGSRGGSKGASKSASKGSSRGGSKSASKGGRGGGSKSSKGAARRR